MFLTLWCVLFPFVASSIWCGNYGWVWSDGAQCVCHVHLQHHPIWRTSYRVRPFLKTSCDRGYLFLLLLFVQSFYAQQLFLFFNNHYLNKEFFVILLFVGTCQVDPFIEPFFVPCEPLLLFFLCDFSHHW